ncbi:MAG: DUF6716 putative glycosyltransferase [Pseudomonadota bacterium]
MLQGPASALWRETRDMLVSRGHRVTHVALALGDRLFWRRPGRIDYRGSLADWPGWIAELIRREGVSDLLYFADCLPYHRHAAEAALALGRRAWAIENGYLRPDWLTMEPVGMGRRSRFTRRPDRLRALAGGARPVNLTPRFTVPFATEARCEMAFNLAHALSGPLYPGWQSDRTVPAWREYTGWLPYLARLGRARARAAAVEAACAAGSLPHVVLAMQMETDYQLRVSSDYPGQAAVLQEVLTSFAAHAPPHMRLVIKLHPFDNGLIDWDDTVARIAWPLGIDDRVMVIRGGRLDRLLDKAHGLITVNSTTAIHALRLGRPVIALGDAVYDVPGLTHQAGLRRFWTDAETPDAQMVAAWVRAVAAEIQIRGHQMHPVGRKVAATAIAERLEQAERYWRLWRDGDGVEIDHPAHLRETADDTPLQARAG